MLSKNEILKKKLIDKILDIFHTVEPEDTNVERMKAFLEKYPDDVEALRENEFLSTR